MSTDGKPIDMNKGMDMSGLAMAGMPGMPGMKMPEVDPESLAARVPQIARYVRYNGWPELKEALVAGKVRAAMMLAPMAMDLADKGVPVKVVALGHRSGAVIMVRKESPYHTFADLKGKTIAIPSRFAVDHIFVRKLMATSGLKDGDLTMIELAPPDMPAALLANAVDAYATGEPFGAKSEMDGYARVLYMTRDVWPTYICCVLTVRQELIDQDPKTVQLLVDHVLAAGQWLESSPQHRTTAARIASDQSMFNQAFDLIKWVMERPPDRVTYGDLRLVRSEFDELMRLSLDAKIIGKPIPYETYVDETFMRNARPVDITLTAP
jgi:NitT/TauT family transport system substrate-binding protein